jgi:diguanylate cyclase (GGDEF)-like protein
MHIAECAGYTSIRWMFCNAGISNRPIFRLTSTQNNTPKLFVIRPDIPVMPALWMAKKVSRLSERLSNAPGWLLASGTFASVAIIAFVDKATGPDTSIGVFYILPIVASAWALTRPVAYAVSAICAVAWYGDSQPLYPAELDIFKFAWNMIMLGGVFASLSLLVRAARILIDEQKRLAATDALTGLPNARAFKERLELEIARSHRSNVPLTLVYVDCDNFKTVNDTLGHRIGDELLVSVGAALRQSIRTTDVAARIGGDEFALLLADCDRIAADRVIGELRRAVEAISLHQHKVTLSVGVATGMGAGLTFSRFVDRADAALYQAKNAGRNQVCFDDQPNPVRIAA